MAEDNGNSSLTFGRKDMIYAAALLTTFGGGQLLTQAKTANVDVIAEKVTSLEHNVGELQLAVRIGVSRETVDDLKVRLTEGRDANKDLRLQIEGLRASIDNLRGDVAQAVGQRLAGPRR